MVKTSLLRKKQKRQKGYLKGEVGQAKRGTGAGMMRYQGIQDRAFTYSSRLAWTDSILFFSSTSLLLPTHLPPPSCMHAQSCNPLDCSPNWEFWLTVAAYITTGSIAHVFPIIHSVIIKFPCGSAGKKSVCNVGDLGSIPGLGRSPGEGKGYPLQYSGLENSMDCTPWGCKELDRTERLTFTLLHVCIEYWWILNRLLTAKGYVRTQLCIKGNVPELEKPLWLLCMHLPCAGVGKISVVIL